MNSYSAILAVLVWALSTAAQQCTLQFDGRILANMTLEDFDSSPPSPFNPSYDFGKNLTWDEIIKFPNVTGSLFDVPGYKPIEVTINDESIFAPSSSNVQVGFRRAELLPASNSGTDPSTSGIKTLHFSVMKDTSRPLNLSHEYQIVFLESNDYSTNQFVLKTGTIIGGDASVDPDSLILVGNVNDSPVKTLDLRPFTPGVWHNYGVVLNFTENTTSVLYSYGFDPLAQVTAATSNDLSGQGEFHFGLLKKPTGNDLTDLPHQGYQESGINEGIIFGGIFEEDSQGGCVTLTQTGSASYDFER